MHLGIIPDGNRRWARARQTTVSQAYAIGFCRVVQAVQALSRAGVGHFTFFGMSEKNYKERPSDQIDDLLSRVIDSMSVATQLLVAESIRVRFFGNTAALAPRLSAGLLNIEEATEAYAPATTLNILLNYSGSWDLRSGSHATSAIPPCDLVFRTGGGKRLSGFLPVQSSEAVLYFTRRLWPDIRPIDLQRAISTIRSNRPVE